MAQGCPCQADRSTPSLVKSAVSLINNPDARALAGAAFSKVKTMVSKGPDSEAVPDTKQVCAKL